MLFLAFMFPRKVIALRKATVDSIAEIDYCKTI